MGSVHLKRVLTTLCRVPHGPLSQPRLERISSVKSRPGVTAYEGAQLSEGTTVWFCGPFRQTAPLSHFPSSAARRIRVRQMNSVTCLQGFRKEPFTFPRRGLGMASLRELEQQFGCSLSICEKKSRYLCE